MNNSQIKKAMSQPRWKTVDVAISKKELRENFDFLNKAVVVRPDKEGWPLMTTTGIYGPILKNQKVILTPGEGTGVAVIPEGKKAGKSLIDELIGLYNKTKLKNIPEQNRTLVNAKWVSAADGGSIPMLGSSSNVFGETGSLLVKDLNLNIPVLDHTNPDYHQTLAFYGGKLLKPNEPFKMGIDKKAGFDMTLFGMEYDTKQPGYIRDYELQPYAGGGLFVEVHPFPHIFLPKPDENGEVFCEAGITLGRRIFEKEPKNLPKENRHKFDEERPMYSFTTFRIPSDGSAISIMPFAIHNDSFTRGKLTVYLANTPADTVALRSSAPYQNIFLKDAYD